MPNVIILFLAYQGVTQPAFWERWKDYCSESKNLIFKVHAPSDAKYGTEFSRRYNIGFYNPVTNWCGASLIYVFLQCIKKITDEYKDGSLYLVSGTDIPIVPADVLFGKISIAPDNKLYKSPFNTKICVLKRNAKNRPTSEVQWMSLNLRDAKALYTLMIEDDVFYTLKQKWLIDIRENKGYTDNCPDNYFISTAIVTDKKKWIAAGGKPKTYRMLMNPAWTQHGCITSDPRGAEKASSPVYWTDNKKKEVFNLAGPRCLRANLKFVLSVTRLESSNQIDSYFFRKVGPDVDMSEFDFFINPEQKDPSISRYQEFKNYFDREYVLNPVVDWTNVSNDNFRDVEEVKCTRTSNAAWDAANERMAEIISLPSNDGIITLINIEKILDKGGDMSAGHRELYSDFKSWT